MLISDSKRRGILLDLGLSTALGLDTEVPIFEYLYLVISNCRILMILSKYLNYQSRFEVLTKYFSKPKQLITLLCCDIKKTTPFEIWRL